MIQANIKPTVTLAPDAAAVPVQTGTGLIDCGNWGISASWTFPAPRSRALHRASRPRRQQGGRRRQPDPLRRPQRLEPLRHLWSDLRRDLAGIQQLRRQQPLHLHGELPVREPAGLQGGGHGVLQPPVRRGPHTDSGNSDPFYAEYQMIRFLEAQRLRRQLHERVATSTANGALLQATTRSSSPPATTSTGRRVSARTSSRRSSAGVNLAFFSGNEIFWKTRWGPSIDGSNTPYRTVTTYKETHYNAQVDPQDPPTWTGTWADPRFSPPADGGNPANALTGQQFVVNSGSTSLTVPSTYSKLRFWRNTAVAKLAAGKTAELAPDQSRSATSGIPTRTTDSDPRASSTCPRRRLSGVQAFTDYGSLTNNNATDTHHLTLYRAPSGALVFGAGTVQWSWGLDITNAFAEGGSRPEPTRPTRACSRRRSTSWPTWARSRRR